MLCLDQDSAAGPLSARGVAAGGKTVMSRRGGVLGPNALCFLRIAESLTQHVVDRRVQPSLQPLLESAPCHVGKGIDYIE